LHTHLAVEKRNLINSLKNRLIYEQLLNKVSLITLEDSDIDDCINKSLQVLGETLLVSRAYLLEPYQETNINNNFVWVSPGIVHEKNNLHDMSECFTPWLLNQVENNKIICFSDIEDIPDEITKKIILNQRIKSLFIIPLFVKNIYYGCLGFDVWGNYREWLEVDVNFLQSIARILCSAIANDMAKKSMNFERIQYCTMFDNINAGIYVSDIENYKILYANKFIKDIYGREPIGELCYKVLHNKDYPCIFCTNQIIKETKDKPYIWEHYNTFVNKYFEITNKIIRWRDGRDVRFEYMCEMSKYKQVQTELLMEKEAIKSLEAKLKKTNEKLQILSQSTITALSELLEQKDSYTASHQTNVANLSCAIAKEMKLPEEQIKGIKVAALLHDIGKIAIPLDILNKPRNLTDNEFNLIKEHVQNGFEVIKTLEFSWPIAKIILQHHERMNGSGYPNGLRNNEILIEAKILAVADTIDAMSSHRPYRPARGLGEAMAEVLKHSNVLYDSEVVKACLSVLMKENKKNKVITQEIFQYASNHSEINKINKNIVCYNI